MKWLTSVILAVIISVGPVPATATRVEPQTATVQISKDFFKTSEQLTVLQEETKRMIQLQQNTDKVSEVIHSLKKRVGKTPYVYSGWSPKYGWDCSGMVMWTYRQLGIKLEHSATKQGYSGKRVKNPKIGDIVVFGTKGSKMFYHAAIYIGDGKIINANNGYGGTVIQPLSDYDGSRIVFRRLIDTL